MCSTLIIGLRHSACLAPVNCSCLTAFVGWEANLLMYLQEPPRGDGASSSVNFPLPQYTRSFRVWYNKVKKVCLLKVPWISHCHYLQVKCSFRIGWRRSFNAGTRCSLSQRNTQAMIPGPGSTLSCLTSSACVSRRIDNLNFGCTEISASEDWTQGGRSFVAVTRQTTASEMRLR